VIEDKDLLAKPLNRGFAGRMYLGGKGEES